MRTHPELASFVLSSPGLVGSLPDFSKNTALVEVKLNHNKLEGTVPNFLANTKVEKIWLNENLLEGAFFFNSNVQGSSGA